MRKVLAGFGALLVVLGFTGAVVSATVKARLVSEDYFQATLTGANVYERLYSDLANDPQFAPQLDKLLGGVNVKKEEVVMRLKQVVKPEYLKAMVDDAIKRLVAYLDGSKPLDLSMDITPILNGIHGVAVNTAQEIIVALPVEQAASLEDFAAKYSNILKLMAGEGELPSAIPAFPIPDEYKRGVALELAQAAQLDENNPEDLQVLEGVANAILTDDVATAIKIGAASLLEKLITQSVLALTEHPLVKRIEAAGVVSFSLSPPPRVTAKLASSLKPVKQVGEAATWLLPATIGVLVLGLGVIAAALWRRKNAILTWMGGALVAGGILGFGGWMFAKSTVIDQVDNVVIAKTTLPKSLKTIMSDTVSSATTDLSPWFWGPSIALIVIGGALIMTGALRARRGGAAAVGA